MISAISNVAPAQPAPQAATAQPTSSKATTSGQICGHGADQQYRQDSVAGNPGNYGADCAQEARGGDNQALKLMAREAAAKASAK